MYKFIQLILKINKGVRTIPTFIPLPMLCLLISITKGDKSMVATGPIVISTLFFVCLIVAILLIWIGSYFYKNSNKSAKTSTADDSKRKDLMQHLSDLEHAIDDVRDSISSDDNTIQNTGDEGVRKLVKAQKETHLNKLHKLEAQRDAVSMQLIQSL